MNRMEILIALLGNIKGLVLGCALISGVMLALSGVALFIAFHEYRTDAVEVALIKKTTIILLWLTIGLGLFTCIPNIDDLWRVRIGLIKLQLSSPENVKKGTEEIQRIAKKLECQYLGCNEKKE